MNEIQTWSGKMVDPFHLTARDIEIVDIAQSLSRLCRFTGHIKTAHYSVAEHSYHLSYMVPPELAFEALMHDAAEAYIQDIPTPLKHRPEFAFYRNVEKKIEETMARKFMFSFPLPAKVKLADSALLRIEQTVLMHDKEHPKAPIRIKSWDSEHAYKQFMFRFNQLYHGR